jgi:ParB family chromosome partitioning protein
MRRLERGLSALIGEEVLCQVDVEDVEIGKFKIREYTFGKKSKELVASIKEKGVIQPIIVRPKDGRYELVAGQRRLLAAKEAGLTSVPAIVKEVKEEEGLEIALIENIQREELNPIEEAEAYKRLIEFGLTQEEIGKRVGKSRSTIANTIRLLNLPQSIKERVARGEITEGHARALLSIKSEKKRERMATEISERGLSVRRVEAVSHETQSDLLSFEEKAKRLFGTNVRIKGTTERGRIEIEYYSVEELEGILEKMGVLSYANI